MRGRRAAGWGLLALTLLLAGVQILSVPFYAGSRIGGWGAWRLENGRLTIWRRAGGTSESFFIANNTEGLRFMPMAQLWSLREWRVVIPVWMPLVAAGVGGVVLFRRSKDGGPRCRRCGYALAGLASGASCPECGRRAPEGGAGGGD